MKRWKAAAAAALMMFAGTALAQDETQGQLKNVALFAPKDGGITAAMYEEPSEDSALLMNYFKGVMVEVLDTQDGWVHIQAGPDELPLEGYVREADLEQSAEYQRTADSLEIRVALKEDTNLWNSCKTRDYSVERVGAGMNIPIIGVRKEKDGIWMQTDDANYEQSIYTVGEWFGGNMHRTYGYFFLTDESYAGEFHWRKETIQRPLEGELTYEQAYEKAIDVILSGEHDSAGYAEEYFPEFMTEEKLRGMNARVWLSGSGDDLIWIVSLSDDELDGTLEVYFSPDGEQVQDISYGFG